MMFKRIMRWLAAGSIGALVVFWIAYLRDMNRGLISGSSARAPSSHRPMATLNTRRVGRVRLSW